MIDVLSELSRPLGVDDVELRIGQTSQKGFSLLLYKTARTDIKRLNDSGAIWRNEHTYDPLGLMTCIISIYHTKLQIWVDRVDVGTESQTEKQKGLYSDSFKRAGFRWGIGLELYNAPFIWITWEMEKNQNGKWQPKAFYSSNLKIDKYSVIDSEFADLKISYSGKEVYSHHQTIDKYKTFSNATGKDMNSYKKDFAKVCNKYLLENEDINDFLEWTMGTEGKPNEVHNEVVRFLKGGEEQLAGQIDSYLTYRRKHSA